MSQRLNKLKLGYSFDCGIDFDNRIIRLTGIIDGKSDAIGDTITFDTVDSALTNLESMSDEPITLRIVSPGGSVYDALAIVGRIRSSKCKIITEGYGCIMSAATLIMASGDYRRLSKYCISMFHQASYGYEGSHEEVKEYVNQAEKEENLWSIWMSELSSKGVSFWKRKTKKKNLYLTAEQMLDHGVVDEIF